MLGFDPELPPGKAIQPKTDLNADMASKESAVRRDFIEHLARLQADRGAAAVDAHARSRGADLVDCYGAATAPRLGTRMSSARLCAPAARRTVGAYINLPYDLR